jgi:hypothetical protein
MGQDELVPAEPRKVGSGSNAAHRSTDQNHRAELLVRSQPVKAVSTPVLASDAMMNKEQPVRIVLVLAAGGRE